MYCAVWTCAWFRSTWKVSLIQAYVGQAKSAYVSLMWRCVACSDWLRLTNVARRDCYMRLCCNRLGSSLRKARSPCGIESARRSHHTPWYTGYRPFYVLVVYSRHHYGSRKPNCRAPRPSILCLCCLRRPNFQHQRAFVAALPDRKGTQR